MHYKSLLFICCFCLIVSCKQEEGCGEQHTFEPSDIGFTYENLTHELYQIESVEALEVFFEHHPIVKNQFFAFGNLMPEQAFLNELLKFTQSPLVKELYQVQNYSEFANELEQNRTIREFLTFLWLKENPGKSDQDVFELLSRSEITNQNNVEQIAQYLDAHPEERLYYEVIFEFVSAEDLLRQNFSILQNEGIDTIYREILQVFDADALAFEIGAAFQNIKQNFPDFKPPHVKFIYSAFGKDMYLTDSTLVIGLDYFLGEGATYRPNIYEYLLNRMKPEYIVPQVVQYVSLAYNPSSALGNTMLDEMIYHGKALAFTKAVLPCIPDSIIMGYNQQDFANATVSEPVIWSHFLENELVYQENPNLITKYVDERPNVPEIDPRCPGRIGRFIGWQIVKNFQDNEEKQLFDLMKENDSQHILRRSKYNPRLP
mgnify:CR=1 FL=1